MATDILERHTHSHERTEVPKLSYVKALDGIRAVSVASVVLFHAGVKYFGGGYMGVEGFFVLSGFLITSLLLADYSKNKRISFSSFYARRARRLFPALFILIMAVVIGELFFGDKSNSPSIRGDALAAIFYVSNWYYIATHSSYFGQFALTSPLQHAWSLAIEEQFYIFWPLTLFVIFKLRRNLKHVFIFAVAGSFFSALLMAITFSTLGLNFAYYATFTRAQALLIGCSLAVALTLYHEKREAFKAFFSRIGPFCAVGALFIWYLSSGPSSFMFYGGFYLADILTACVIALVVLNSNSVVSKILSTWPFVSLGKISYGVYLWMFPIILYITQLRTGLNALGTFGLRVFLILLISTSSYFLVEKPIRSGQVIKRWRPFVLTPLVVITAVTTSIFAGTQTPSLKPLNVNPVKDYTGPPMKVLMAGDSVAVTLGVGLSEQDYKFGTKVYDVAKIGCGVIREGEIDEEGTIGYPGGSPNYCAQQIAQYQSEVKTIDPNVSVLLAGRWEVTNRNFGDGWTHIGEPQFDAILMNDLIKVVNILHSTGAPVVLLTCPYFEKLAGANGAVYPEDNPGRVDLFNRILTRVKQRLGSWVYIINLNQKVDPNGQFQEYIDGFQVRDPDGIHFSYPTLSQYSPTYPSGGLWLSPWLLPQLRQIALNNLLSNKKT